MNEKGRIEGEIDGEDKLEDFHREDPELDRDLRLLRSLDRDRDLGDRLGLRPRYLGGDRRRGGDLPRFQFPPRPPRPPVNRGFTFRTIDTVIS